MIAQPIKWSTPRIYRSTQVSAQMNGATEDQVYLMTQTEFSGEYDGQSTNAVQRTAQDNWRVQLQ